MKQTDIIPDYRYNGFKVVATTDVKSMNATAIEIIHEQSGARIFHISCPDRENCFCVSVPTPPPDDTGMPHILEHMSLAGSEKFPCKEPFFEMIKRSVATFINALTGNDITYYPVCSTVKTDLFNLANVYFDAVFHPLLSDATFKREAFHLAPADPEEPLGDLRFDGIVYSEMKGVFSSPEGVLERDSIRKLLPDTCHGKESGGNPESIPELTLETLKKFHATNYHPSNAFIVLYGDIPTHEWLDFLTPRLADFQKIEPQPPPARQPKWQEPKELKTEYPLPKDEETSERTYLMLNWLIGDSTDIAFTARISVLSYLLTGHDGSPLKKAITDSHVGANVIFAGPSPNGLEYTYHLAVDGSEANRIDDFRNVVFTTLKELSQKPFDKDDIDAAFQQAIYACNEIGSNHAFNVAMNTATAWTAGMPPTSLLERHPYFEQTRKELDEDPMLLSRMIKELFIDNPHRLDIVLSPSHDIEEKQAAELQEQLKKIRQSLTDDEVKKIAQDAAELEQINATPNSEEDIKCLPRLLVSDVSPSPAVIPVVRDTTSAGGLFIATDNLPTNDIVYLKLSFDIRGLPEQYWNYLSRYTNAVSDFGTKEFNYALTAKRRASCTGSLSASIIFRTTCDGSATFLPAVEFNLKTTVSSLDKALDILHEAIFELDPEDKSRMADVIIQDRTILRSDFVQDARSTTRLHSARKLNIASYRKNQYEGLPELALLEHLASITQEDAYDESVKNIISIRDFILAPTRVNIALTAPEGVRKPIKATVEKWLAEMQGTYIKGDEQTEFKADLTPRNEGLAAALQVSFSALCAPAPHISNAAAIPFSVGASIVSADYMLPEIRFKGNAYGAGLTYTPESSIIYFSSYRDPHISETYETIFRATDFVKSAKWTKELVDNAILTKVKLYEQPIRPTQACSTILSRELCGMTDEYRAQNYARLISLKPEEVQETTIRVLEKAFRNAAYCVAASEAALEASNIPGLTISPIIPR